MTAHVTSKNKFDPLIDPNASSQRKATKPINTKTANAGEGTLRNKIPGFPTERKNNQQSTSKSASSDPKKPGRLPGGNHKQRTTNRLKGLGASSSKNSPSADLPVTPLKNSSPPLEQGTAYPQKPEQSDQPSPSSSTSPPSTLIGVLFFTWSHLSNGELPPPTVDISIQGLLNQNGPMRDLSADLLPPNEAKRILSSSLHEAMKAALTPSIKSDSEHKESNESAQPSVPSQMPLTHLVLSIMQDPSIKTVSVSIPEPENFANHFNGLNKGERPLQIAEDCQLLINRILAKLSTFITEAAKGIILAELERNSKINSQPANKSENTASLKNQKVKEITQRTSLCQKVSRCMCRYLLPIAAVATLAISLALAPGMERMRREWGGV